MKSQYELELKSRENGNIYRFQSADGLNSKNSFRDEELLLVDEVQVEKTDRILVIQSGYGFLGAVLGDKAEFTVMQDTSSRACEFSKKNAKGNQVEGFNVENKAVEDIQEEFDKIIYAPADYEPVDLVKNRLTYASEKLTENGKIFLAGRKKSGIKRYRKHLQDAGDVQKIGSRGAIRAYRFKPQSNFSLSELDLEKEFRSEVDGFEADFTSSEGLFSHGKLDEGTRILLENLELSNPDKVLDLACGYGAISVFTAKMSDADLFLTDDSVRATEYAKRNLERNDIQCFEVKTGDCLDAFSGRKFDLIISNPPTHQGKGITEKIFSQAHDSLEKGGSFWLVYNQNMNYQAQLGQEFDRVEQIALQDNFKVVKAVK
ncbi:methyltransferase [Candidatus Nanohalobium constans]|uniref:16S rRNA (Guanine1207-N2)-methyltransferase n=1 Tax=Candidatus Nanohalobium constans TaxID=2565781 RepID=A0A5Q0UIM8_9ARCH|nr:methyltransferase [Candidatus Nanohalobium constans]QGA80980.1 16S rRNA (guanine1207-N2)-methyltransferase [Candidatus Nanohalobium constans]